MFQQTDDLSYSVRRERTEQKVYMVLVESDCVDINREPFFEPFECREYEFLDVGYKERFTILYRDLSMVVAFGDIVVPVPNAFLCFDIGSRHSYSIPNVAAIHPCAGAQGVLAAALKFKELSPIQDMRPNSNGMVYLNDENSLEQTFNFVYQIRCNLFHGAKDIKDARDAELVSRGAKFLRFCIDRWMKGD